MGVPFGRNKVHEYVHYTARAYMMVTKIIWMTSEMMWEKRHFLTENIHFGLHC
jgi:hypothetical protein